MGARPVALLDALRFGDLIHKALEAWWTNRWSAERLDLDTLEVRCREFPERYASISGGELSLVYETVGKPGIDSLVLSPESARLLARALTQWADDQEGKGS